MRRVAFVQDLHGTLTAVGPGLLDASLSACDGGNASLVSQLKFAEAERFTEDGCIELASGDVLFFRTLFAGFLTPAPDPALRLGSAVRHIHAGSGALEGAAGRITSTFVVDREGRISDREMALIFLAERST